MNQELLKQWTPVIIEMINALPDPIRQYIHDIETNCDPAGMVAENTLLKDQIRQLDALIARLKVGSAPCPFCEHATSRIEWMVEDDMKVHCNHCRGKR